MHTFRFAKFLLTNSQVFPDTPCFKVWIVSGIANSDCYLFSDLI